MIQINEQTKRVRFVIAVAFMGIIVFSYIKNVSTREERRKVVEQRRAELTSSILTLEPVNIYRLPDSQMMPIGSIPENIRFKILDKAYGNAWFKISVNDKQVWVKNQSLNVNY